MGEAIIHGLLKHKKASPQSIFISDIDEKRTAHLVTKYKVNVSTNQFVAKDVEVLILAVKPQNMRLVCEGIKDSVSPGSLIISLAAGITLNFLKGFFPGHNLVRAMPNNPCLIGQGTTVLSWGKIDQAAKKETLDIFSAVGETLEIGEAHMDTVTALSGSGPAFVYVFAQALAKAGQHEGLSEKDAQFLAYSTLKGSVLTLKESNKSVEELIAMVASPKGTTEEGLLVLEKKQLSKIIHEAVIAAKKRSIELSQKC